MTNKLNPLETYALIFNMLENRVLEGNEFKGWLTLDAQLKCDLELLVQHELTSGSYQYSIKGSVQDTVSLETIHESHYHDSIKFRISLVKESQNRMTPIFEGWDALLQYPENLRNPLQAVFFTSPAKLIELSACDSKFGNYQKLKGLIEILDLLIESNEGGSHTLYYQRPVKFTFVLREADLNQAIDIAAIYHLLEKDTHKEAVKNLISAQIVSRVKDVPADRRFAELVRTNTYLVADVLLDYQGYVENYSFDKVRKEYLDKKTDYISRIENRFDEISLKLLSLPAGIGLATTQIQEGMIGELEFVKNVSVLLTVLILVILLCINIYGQFSVIRSIETDYTSTFLELAKKFSEEGSRISDCKTEIDNKKLFTVIKLWFAIAMSVCLFLLTFAMLVYSYR